MFARKLALVVVLLVATPAFGDFQSDLYMTATADGVPLADGGAVDPSLVSQIAVKVMDAHVWNNATSGFPKNPLNSIVVVSLNFENSDIDVSTAAWTWDMWAASLLTTVPVDDAVNDDGFVIRTSGASSVFPLNDQLPIDLGTLAFPVPAYNPGGPNTYTMRLDGGEYNEAEEIDTTTRMDGYGSGEFAHLTRAGSLDLGEFGFTVTPEPATLALLALGGAAMFIRRKR